MPDIAIKWALLSVSDKSGLQDFARALTANGSKILPTGGSYRFLLNNDIAAREVADYTQFPEILQHTDYHLGNTADLLGISRSTPKRRMQRYRINN